MKNKLRLLIQNKIISDEELELFLSLAENAVLAYTNRKSMIKELEMLTIELASFYYHTKQNAGVSSRSEGAISESYISANELPKSIETSLQNYRIINIAKCLG